MAKKTTKKSAKKSTRKASKKAATSECVEMLFEDHLMIYAQRSDVDVFRKQMKSKGVQDMFKRHRKKLAKIFIKYSAADQHGDAAAQMDTMNVKEFMGLCLAKNLVDSNFSKKTVATIFSSLQSDEIAGDGDEDEGAEMDYNEFVQMGKMTEDVKALRMSMDENLAQLKRESEETMETKIKPLESKVGELEDDLGGAHAPFTFSSRPCSDSQN